MSKPASYAGRARVAGVVRGAAGNAPPVSARSPPRPRLQRTLRRELAAQLFKLMPKPIQREVGDLPPIEGSRVLDAQHLLRVAHAAQEVVARVDRVHPR